ncbi:MAG: response regulator [Rubrivivax sp.]|nr:response regulator [Pyrinomonadaceae bacterium]
MAPIADIIFLLDTSSDTDKRFPRMANTEDRARTILVVEDYDDIRELMRHHLGKRGYEVITASNGEDAVILAERVRPDLILMDISLPERSGISATYKILKSPSLSGTPVVAVTGFTNADLHQDALDAGCRAVYLKPLTPEGLEEILALYMPSE